jgi:8-oxo-dGTP pyrophosphatase MutT (NUDIX family)
MSEKAKNQWICHSERKLFAAPVISLYEQECVSSEDPAGKAHKFYRIKAPDWCNIIPITEDGNVVMVRQYRIGISAHTLEIPGGIADPEDENVQAAALRELKEETGFAPVDGARCLGLGFTHPNPAIQDNRVHAFVVGPVSRVEKQKLDPSEMIEVEQVPVEEIPSRILKGEISHALMLNTFFLLLLRAGGQPEKMIQELRAFATAR